MHVLLWYFLFIPIYNSWVNFFFLRKYLSLHTLKLLWQMSFNNCNENYFVYKKAFIQTSHISFWLQNNLCELIPNMRTQIQKVILYSKTSFKWLALKISGIQNKSNSDLVWWISLIPKHFRLKIRSTHNTNF